jgi:HlyD family secretion protein
VVSPSRSSSLLLLVATLLLVACDREEGPQIETARVDAAEVVQTVAAAAELEPAGRVAVTAPVGGEVIELLVEDGDTVEVGQRLVRLRSDAIELQIAQAEAALGSADAAAGAAGAAGVDLSPVLRALRGQLEAVLPPVIEGFEQQARDIENDRLRERAEQRAAEARASYQASVAELRGAEQELAGQAEQATAAQRQAVAAQRRQAELALEAASSREDELVVVAPADGVVELARGGEAGGAGFDLDALGEGAAGLEGLGDLGGLAGGGGTDQPSGPLAEGVSVGPGQPLLTVYDLSDFTARVEVDEIDAVEVEEGQRAMVLVDAYPEVELEGRIDHVAIAPERGPGGGALFPVTVRLLQVPDDVRLRVGLTASSEIEVRRVAAETAVPTSALLRRGADDLVRVVRDGVVHDTPVEVLALGEQLAAVRGDLEVGDRVVTLGVEELADGDELP